MHALVARLAVLLAAAPACHATRGSGASEPDGSFPCRADQWLPANWTMEEAAWVCSSCYVCKRGDQCLQRGGCVRCEDDHFDHDTDPTTL